MNVALRGAGRRGNSASGGTMPLYGFGKFVLVERFMRVQSLDGISVFASSRFTRQVMSQEAAVSAASARQPIEVVSTARVADFASRENRTDYSSNEADTTHESVLPETDYQDQALDLAVDSASYDETVETTIPATLDEST